VRAADRLLQALGTCRRWEWTTVLFLAHADAIAHSHLPRAQQAANENCFVLVPKYQFQAEGLSAAKIHRLHWRHSGSVAVAAPASLDFHRRQSPGRGRRGCIRNGRWQGIGIDGSAACYLLLSCVAAFPGRAPLFPHCAKLLNHLSIRGVYMCLFRTEFSPWNFTCQCLPAHSISIHRSAQIGAGALPRVVGV